HVFFALPSVPGPADLAHVARELVAFVQRELPKLAGDKTYHPPYADNPRGKLPAFKYLRFFSCIWINPRESHPKSWSCNDVAQVGVGESRICGIINEKAKKRKEYALHDVCECWLLICSTGETAANSAGPMIPQTHSVFDTEGVRKACAESGFGRIIWWEKFPEWIVDFSLSKRWCPCFFVKPVDKHSVKEYCFTN
ncbi:MAG: hypothetical protein Q7R47_02150, partial [Candidatus Diapherotrites archaeon]|nr:hypothetical protein [Candidatus Diapherotrites archaeon]